MPSQVT